MQTSLAPSTSLPFDLGEPRSFRGLTIVPLSAAEPRLDYVGLDEAAAGGLVVTELSEAGSVETLLVVNPLKTPVLLYEGEELVGAKQNRVLERSVLVAAGSKLEIPAKCVEQGRWAYRSAQFAPAPRAAYPELRRIRHDLGAPSQAAVWSEVAAKSARIGARSVTGAAEAMYVERRATLDEYVQALPRLDGQAGAIVGIAGRLVCLDYVSRSDVFAGLYLKLLRGYALSASEQPLDKPLRRRDVGRFLGELELAKRTRRPAVGLGEEGVLTEYAVGAELSRHGEVIALSAYPGQA
jgi:ARG/rhodanese/phosphatase superfamily protein